MHEGCSRANARKTVGMRLVEGSHMEEFGPVGVGKVFGNEGMKRLQGCYK